MQVGHNHGLYRIGSDAVATGPPGDTFTEPGGPSHTPYFDQWAQLAERLAQLPSEVRTILVMLLPKVGAVANLRPGGVERDQGYAATYEPVLSTSTSVLAGSHLLAIDQEIQNANARIKKLFLDAADAAGTVNRVKFLDVYALFEARDYKNSLDASRRIR